jgi:hypothetical protein
MKIFACSDVHGATGTVERALGNEPGLDAIVVAGDLTTHGTPEEAEDFLTALMRFGPPVLAVAGNMDPPLLEQTLTARNVSLNGTGVILGEVGFFGVSSCPPTPFRTPYEISEEEIMKRAESGWEAVRAAKRKIFVPHAPPAHTAVDRTWTGLHVGSTAVRDFIERRQPDLVLCGHIHEARGTDWLGKTLIVNCGAAGHGSYAIATIAESASAQLKEVSR